MEKHQCEQPGELTWWLATEKRAQEACKPDGLGRELGPLHRRTPRSGVALVEKQVEDGENAVQTRGHLAWLGDHVGDVRRGNLALGSDKALSHRGRRDHERAGDFVRVEAEQGAETQRHLGFQRQGRVAAGEDESKQIVRDLEGVRGRERFIDGEGVGLELGGQHLLARRRSIAKYRAVWISQARGYSGTPPSRQRVSAASNASWVASSARLKSPVSRINVARTRAHSAR